MRRVHHAGDLPPDVRVVRADDLRLPFTIVFGLLEGATNEELSEHSIDITHELDRRARVS